MADIAFNCPHCDQSLEAPEDLGGTAIECPACSQALTIPVPEPDAGDKAAAECLCPSCGAPMPGGAVLCVACGYHLKLRRRIKTSIE